MADGEGTVAAPAVARSRGAWLRPGERVRHATVAQKVGALLVLAGINLFVYFLPIDYQAIGTLAYAGTLIITFVANAAVVLPVPYIPVVAHIAATAEHVWLVVLIGALGSTLGESVAFAVGRVERDLFSDHALYRRVQRLMGSPWRAGGFLFLFAAPLNPIFDVAGLAAGALGLPYRVFFTAVFLARLVRFAVIAAIATGLARLSLLGL
ncbi:MAG TPA: VTT domain-containing protein [Candidatus Limnocylindrales bacterium]|nr:VTT domain-containing protein [Candidatus Limnocylindrales bacterium]